MPATREQLDRFRPMALDKVRGVPRFKIKKGLDPAVTRLFEEMKRQSCTYQAMADRLGMSLYTIRGWQRNHQPRIGDLEAAYNVLGFTLRPVELKE